MCLLFCIKCCDKKESGEGAKVIEQDIFASWETFNVMGM